VSRTSKLLFSLTLSAVFSSAQAQSPEPIAVGSILDETGPINVYGKAMADATRLAVQHINDTGGVLGRPLRLVSYDAQSDNAKYTTYTNQLALRDKVAVILGGITSASRDAIRPAARRHGVLYLYNTTYEGGLCDKGVFLTGVVPSQQVGLLVDWAAKNVGKKFYSLAADYNYGHIATQWVKHYVQKAGGEVLAAEFIPLDVAEFGSVIAKLQEAKPDVVYSNLVGGNHTAFYRQFAAAGLQDRIKIVSSVFGIDNAHVVLDPAESKDIVVAYPYLQEIDTEANRTFRALWHSAYGSDYPYISDSAVSTWNAWHLWAAAANKAGSVARDKVIAALESGISFDGPSGRVTMDPGSHHLIQNMHLGRTNDQHGFTILDVQHTVAPAFEQEVCNLVNNPRQSRQFTPDIN